MIHRHHTVAGHGPGEHHRAGAGGEHGNTVHRGQVNTEMPRPVSERRRVESPDHGGETGKRPAEPRSGFVAGIVGPDPRHRTGRGHQGGWGHRTGLARLAGCGQVVGPCGHVGLGRLPSGKGRLPSGEHRHEHGADQDSRHADSVTAPNLFAQR